MMNKKLRQEILKELSFLKKQNTLNNFSKTDEKLFEEIANGLNQVLLNEILDDTALQLAVSNWLRAKAAGNPTTAAEKLIRSHPKGGDVLNKINNINVSNLQATKNFDQVANGIVIKAKPGVPLGSLPPPGPPPAGKAPVPSTPAAAQQITQTKLTAGNFIKTKAATVEELAAQLGKPVKEVDALIKQKAITFSPGKLYIVNTPEEAAALLKAGSAATGTATSTATTGAVTATEVSAATKNPSKMFALFERVRKATGSPTVQKFIGNLGKASKLLAVAGAGIYAWQLATNPKALTVDEHILGGASVTEVGALLASQAGYATVAAAAQAVAGGAAIGALIGMGINKLSEYAEEQKNKEEKGEVVMAKGQQAVAMFKEYCVGGYRRGAEADSTLGAIGKAAAGTVANVLTLGQASKAQAGKGTHTPNSWGREDVEDMAILYQNISQDQSISAETKKELSKCFGKLKGTLGERILQQKGIYITENGIASPEEIADALNKVLGTGGGASATPGEAGKTPEADTTTGERYGRSFGCKDVESVKAFQGYLGVTQDGKIGTKTLSLAMKKNPALFKYDIKAYMAVDKEGKPTSEAVNLQRALCNYLAKPERKKEFNQEKQIKKESKDFYDNKKIKNAEVLFEKLIKVSVNKGKHNEQ